MATVAELVLEIQGRDSATATLTAVRASARGLGDELNNVSQIATGVTIGGWLERAPGLLKDAAAAAADDAASQIQLKVAIENTGESWGFYEAAVEGAAKGAERLGFADETARRSLALLTAQTGDASEAQERFAIAMDLSRGTGMDLSTAARLVGKISEENTAVLARYGIQLSKNATEQEALAEIMARFGGQAEAYGNSAAGSFDRFNIAIKNIGESIGSLLLPLMTGVAEFWAMFAQGAVLAVDAVQRWVEGIGNLGDRLHNFVASALDPVIQRTNDFIAIVNKVPGIDVGKIGEMGQRTREAAEEMGAGTAAAGAYGAELGTLADKTDALSSSSAKAREAMAELRGEWEQMGESGVFANAFGEYYGPTAHNPAFSTPVIPGLSPGTNLNYVPPGSDITTNIDTQVSGGVVMNNPVITIHAAPGQDASQLLGTP